MKLHINNLGCIHTKLLEVDRITGFRRDRWKTDT